MACHRKSHLNALKWRLFRAFYLVKGRSGKLNVCCCRVRVTGQCCFEAKMGFLNQPEGVRREKQAPCPSVSRPWALAHSAGGVCLSSWCCCLSWWLHGSACSQRSSWILCSSGRHGFNKPLIWGRELAQRQPLLFPCITAGLGAEEDTRGRG